MITHFHQFLSDQNILEKHDNDTCIDELLQGAGTATSLSIKDLQENKRDDEKKLMLQMKK